ncbi:MAG: glycosyltransferase family 39 protein [Lacunisphaera sp.]
MPLQVAARTVTLACFYLTLPALYLLLGRLGLVPARRLLALALILVCPLYIFYSRSFLMDSMALMFCAWFLFGFIRLMDRRRWYWFLLAAFAGTGAALVKSAILAIWLWPAAAYGAWLLWRDLRGRAWGAALETVFWGAAGVIVPLGMLRGWILLTDPLKERHASAWIFTSRNLAEGNWGLTDIAARFSGKTWGILADRWRDGIMPPWLILSLLAAGLVFLPRVRWPALALAGVFFLAQLLFPYAYAYQDYYFYSCALFLSLGLAYLFFGLLDSRAPRWLCWLLLAVPVFAQLKTYREGYYPGQIAQSEGGFPFTRALRDFLPKDSVIVVAGGGLGSHHSLLLEAQGADDSQRAGE